MSTPTITQTTNIQCNGQGCRQSVEVTLKDIPIDDFDDELFEVCEAQHGWYRGMFCPNCSREAEEFDKADHERDGRFPEED